MIEYIIENTLGATLCFAAVAALGVILFSFRRNKPRAKTPKAGNSIQMPCEECHKELVIHPNELIKISPAEMALVVRCRPSTLHKKLAEYVCPYCEAAYCFSVERKSMDLVGVNLYEPQTKSRKCKECGRKLASPPWPKGRFDERISEAPELQDDYGLECPYCAATLCVACCRDLTRNRTPDGSFLCPRCSRYPVDKFLHF